MGFVAETSHTLVAHSLISDQLKEEIIPASHLSVFGIDRTLCRPFYITRLRNTAYHGRSALCAFTLTQMTKMMCSEVVEVQRQNTKIKRLCWEVLIR